MDGIRGEEKGPEGPWTRGIREGDDGEGDDGPAWSPPTRQVQGRVTEKKWLKARGAKVHPNSGAGRIKDDGHDEDSIYEVKDANKTFVVNAKEMAALRKRAAQVGKQGVLVIKFPGFVMECFIRQEWHDAGNE